MIMTPTGQQDFADWAGKFYPEIWAEVQTLPESTEVSENLEVLTRYTLDTKLRA